MNIIKESQGGQSVEATGEDLALINRLSRKKLTAQEVYTFAVRLCDNEVDRDLERFPEKTLEELAGLFVGKCGIFDHKWSAMGQSARIYRTQVVREEGKLTRAGDGLCYLKGYAYMIRTEANRDLIAEIEGGIKKEVSVGCSVKKALCSVCGGEYGQCGHEKGREYGGKLCYASLEEAADAYEFSFVAVPAQRESGVIKKFGGGSLRELAKGSAQCEQELAKLEKEARMGRSYLEGLRREVLRLGGLAEEELDMAVLRGITGKLEEQELLEMRKLFEQRAQERYPIKPQLGYTPAQDGERDGDGAFLI